MSAFPVTSATLIQKIKTLPPGKDNAAWVRFWDTYSGAIRTFAARKGGEECADDIVMTVLGGIAWNKARAIWREAKANALRKPPMSIPGFILGLSSFVSGLIVSIIFLIDTVVIAALPSLIQFAGYR